VGKRSVCPFYSGSGFPFFGTNTEIVYRHLLRTGKIGERPETPQGRDNSDRNPFLDEEKGEEKGAVFNVVTALTREKRGSRLYLSKSFSGWKKERGDDTRPTIGMKGGCKHMILLGGRQVGKKRGNEGNSTLFFPWKGEGEGAVP